MADRKLIITSFIENVNLRKRISASLFSYIIRQGFENISLVNCDSCQNLVDDKDNCGIRFIDLKRPVFNPRACMYCAKCYRFCETEAIFFNRENSYVKILYNRCISCGKCVVACGYNALKEEVAATACVIKYDLSNNNFLIEGCIPESCIMQNALAQELKMYPGKFNIIDISVDYLIAPKSYINVNDYIIFITTSSNYKTDIADIKSMLPDDANIEVLIADFESESVYGEVINEFEKNITGKIVINGDNISIPSLSIINAENHLSGYYNLFEKIIAKAGIAGE